MSGLPNAVTSTSVTWSSWAIANWREGAVWREKLYAGCKLLTGTPFHPSQPCFFGSEGTDINKETELLRTWIYKKWSDNRNQKWWRDEPKNKKIRARLLPCCVTSSHDLSPFFTKSTATGWPPERQTPSHLAWRLLTYGVYKWRFTAVCPYSSHPFNVFFFLFFDKKWYIILTKNTNFDEILYDMSFRPLFFTSFFL